MNNKNNKIVKIHKIHQIHNNHRNHPNHNHNHKNNILLLVYRQEEHQTSSDLTESPGELVGKSQLQVNAHQTRIRQLPARAGLLPKPLFNPLNHVITPRHWNPHFLPSPPLLSTPYPCHVEIVPHTTAKFLDIEEQPGAAHVAHAATTCTLHVPCPVPFCFQAQPRHQIGQRLQPGRLHPRSVA